MRNAIKTLLFAMCTLSLLTWGCGESLLKYQHITYLADSSKWAVAWNDTTKDSPTTSSSESPLYLASDGIGTVVIRDGLRCLKNVRLTALPPIGAKDFSADAGIGFQICVHDHAQRKIWCFDLSKTCFIELTYLNDNVTVYHDPAYQPIVSTGP